jgi:hypothetical protein
LYSSRASGLTLMTWQIRLPSFVRGSSGMGSSDADMVRMLYAVPQDQCLNETVLDTGHRSPGS